MCSTYDVAAGAVWRVAANSSAAARLGCPIRSWASRSLCGERRGWLVVTEIAELAGDTWIDDTKAALNKWRNNYSGIEDFQAVLDQATKYLAAAKEAGKLGAGINTGRAFGWSMYNGMYSFLGVGGAEIGITYCDATLNLNDGVEGQH